MGQARFAFIARVTNSLIDLTSGRGDFSICDTRASRAQGDLQPKRLATDTAEGLVERLESLVSPRQVLTQIPVIDSNRKNETVPFADPMFEHAGDPVAILVTAT